MPKLVFNNQPGSWHTGSDYPSVPLTRVSWETTPHHALAYIFFGHVNIDFDGSPTAYGPAGINPPPDDDLGNAGNASQGYFGVLGLSPSDPLVTSRQAKIDTTAPKFLGTFPVVQQAKNGDPKPGYYVSTTPHASGPRHFQNSYIDASKIAFGALDGRLAPLGFSLGDYGLAIRHDENLQSAFYFADAGASKFALGECSHRVGKDLGGTGRASHFNNNYAVSFILFPNSGQTAPKMFPELTDNTIKTGLRPRLNDLSRATNAGDLGLLMAFNETGPKTVPQGKQKLEKFLKGPAHAKPANYATILLGLATFGFWPFPDVPREERSPFDKGPSHGPSTRDLFF
ncbi:MAG: hypothetical protein ABJF23_16695 [Bryobacteraceae bacterium]